MPNKYASTCKLYTAPHMVADQNINPPSDFTLAAADCYEGVVDVQPGEWNVNSRLMVREVGIFSNFADGFVFKNIYEKMSLKLTAASLSVDHVLAGTATTTLNFRSVAGAGTSWNTGADKLVPGDVVLATTPNTSQYCVVNTVTNDTAITFSQYPKMASGNVTLTLLSRPSSLFQDKTGLRNISALNTFYDLDWFINPRIASNEHQPVIFVKINSGYDIAGQPPSISPHSTTFLTKSISTDFAGDHVSFDVLFKCEVTLAGL
jgi:hypothetical protein